MVVMKNTTYERREAIKSLISKKQISDQNMLVKLLKELHGIETNQAVVSRDLRHLGVIKRATKGELAYELAQIDITQELLKLAIVSIEHNESMIVVTTHPALAAFVGDCIDQHTDLNILGTLAGENVVFVSPRSIKNIHTVYADLCARLHFKDVTAHGV